MERSKNLIYILWPSFVVAGIGEALFFTLFDPADLRLFGEPLTVSEIAVYTVGFFVFWAFAAAASAMTMFLQRGAAEVNGRCPISDAYQSPPGCPRSSAAGSGE